MVPFISVSTYQVSIQIASGTPYRMFLPVTRIFSFKQLKKLNFGTTNYIVLILAKKNLIASWLFGICEGVRKKATSFNLIFNKIPTEISIKEGIFSGHSACLNYV